MNRVRIHRNIRSSIYYSYTAIGFSKNLTMGFRSCSIEVANLKKRGFSNEYILG